MTNPEARAVVRSLAGVLALATLLSLSSIGQAQPAKPGSREQATYQLARDAYFYAYPIVSMETTMRQVTNVPNASAIPMRAPINQFAHARAYPKAEDKDVVRFSFDTLDSLAWVDVAREPMVLSVPDTGGRYYLLEMLDMWSDVFAVVGQRTTGTRALRFWSRGRTQTNGPADYANVHKVQDGYKLTPLGAFGKTYAPPQSVPTDPTVDGKTPPMVQVNRLDGVTMLTRLRALMGKYPPHANDYPMLFRLRAFGLELEKPFDAKKLDAATVATINAAAKDALEDLTQSMKRLGKLVNGWNVVTETIGTYGTSYKQRAIIALGGLGATLPEDAVYSTAFVDDAGQPLSGANKYVLHFDKGNLPPVDAFWSITIYDKDGFLVPNPINRFAVSDRDKLTFNADGSLDMYVQAESPGTDKESNWLPVPKDAPFAPNMRLYSPRPQVADGTWAPPPLVKAD